ncbi:MAG: DUF2231 domain-containing protein [Acidimicrobiaceae bacterium]|nr:DUF2231 domain-containing protein [Acidimicrobiaceae bacterium]
MATFVFDISTRFSPDSGLIFAATLLLLGAFFASVFAIVTGLVDWSMMVKGSRKRKAATEHMLVQLLALLIFVFAFALRWNQRHIPEAHPLWIVAEGLGVLAVFVGQYLGGKLVYQMAVRVKTSQLQ